VWSCIDPWTRTNGGPHGERPAIAGGDVEPGLAQGHGDHHLTSVGPAHPFVAAPLTPGSSPRSGAALSFGSERVQVLFYD
jgi:hypothetical protein